MPTGSDIFGGRGTAVSALWAGVRVVTGAIVTGAIAAIARQRR
jgi:hypothetical protein